MASTLENSSLRNLCIDRRRVPNFSFDRFQWKQIGLILLLVAPQLFALPEPVYTSHLSKLESEMQQKIRQAELDIEVLLQKLHRVELAPQRGPERLIAVDSHGGRDRLKLYLNSAIKMKIRQLDFLKKQKSYLSGETQIARGLEPNSEKKYSLPTSDAFKCRAFPLPDESSSTYEKVLGFGDYLNPSLGSSSAKTQGIWWANTFGAVVRACAPGEVVLSELVEGRGYVVGIRHNARDVTLYGNLDSTSVKSLKTGMKVPDGAALGFALEKFYFEARRGGEAIDPEQLLGQDSDISSKLN